MEVVELEVDPDPSIPPPPHSPRADEPAFERLESRSRLVSSTPLAPEEAPAPPSMPSDPTIEIAAAEVSSAELEALALHEEERAPASSRRPISLEEKMSQSEEDAPAHHPPPPESGKLPAASPAIELGFQPPPAVQEVARTSAAAEVSVASFVGHTPSTPSARTFGELLDDALSF